jgi:hypothetical protein
MGVIDTLQAASPARRSVTMCVDGALQAEWDAASDRLGDAAKADQDTGSLALPNLTKLVNELDELRERVAASEVTFLFEKMPWTEHIALRAQHPPRPDNLLDRIRGFNIDTFYPEVIKASCVSVTDVNGDVAAGRAAAWSQVKVLGPDGEPAPELPDEVWDGLLGRPATDDAPATAGSLNMGQVNTLVQDATQVNEGKTTVPPSARSLLGSQDSGASLAQPDPGKAPRRSGSTGGSRRTSPKSSGTRKATSKKAKSTGS